MRHIYRLHKCTRCKNSFNTQLFNISLKAILPTKQISKTLHIMKGNKNYSMQKNVSQTFTEDNYMHKSLFLKIKKKREMETFCTVFYMPVPISSWRGGGGGKIRKGEGTASSLCTKSCFSQGRLHQKNEKPTS